MTHTASSLEPGNFTGLAQNYAEYRPGYNRDLVRAFLALIPAALPQATLADVGAGTGIFTKLLTTFKPAKLYAVEPNDDMRSFGARTTDPFPVQWKTGSAEQTGLPTASCDFLSMASSFHWADTQVALNEFLRVLRPGGVFVAIWNPRALERNKVLKELEDKLYMDFGLKKRVSSGASGITAQLTDILNAHSGFGQSLYMEAEDVTRMTKDRYMGIWRSVNDVRAQLGEKKFSEFLAICEKTLDSVPELDVTYRTRAWVATKA